MLLLPERSVLTTVVLLAFAAGCSFHSSFDGTAYRCGADEACPSGFTCAGTVCVALGPTPDGGADAPSFPDAPPGVDVWRDDSADDFGAGAALTSAFVDPGGAVEPAAYYTGGLLQGASDTGVIAAAASATWDQVQAMPSTGRLSITRSVGLEWGTATPAGVGLTNGDTWTSWFEGEVFLEAGRWTFIYYADDQGFVELGVPGAAFRRVINATLSGEVSGTFDAPTAGWYPIRYTVSDNTGAAESFLSFSGPGVARTQIPRNRFRVRADQVTGLVQSGFDDSRLLGEYGTTIDDQAPADVAWGQNRPGDLGLTGSETFSVRWSGQLRIDIGGDYRFLYHSDDGQRLWVDGLPLTNRWDETSHDEITAPMPLDPGWHDIVIDQSEAGGDAAAQLKVASGPDLVGVPLPPDRLRPVEGRGERCETAVNPSDVAIPDQATVTTTLSVTAPAGAVVHGLDVGYGLNHSYWGDLTITLIAPNGTSKVLRREIDDSGARTDSSFRTDFDGVPVAGTWTLKVVDGYAQDSGTLQDFTLTAHYSGGEAPIADLAVYESAVRDLGGTSAIEKVAWFSRAPAGSDVAVKVRTCATAAACASAAWSAPLADPEGSVPEVPAGAFAQYRVELSSDGDAAAALDAIQIESRRQ